eukprot:scaffold748_cov251-Pinguiococcus_pyrenoidosus.AAC.43
MRLAQRSARTNCACLEIHGEVHYKNRREPRERLSDAHATRAALLLSICRPSPRKPARAPPPRSSNRWIAALTGPA